MINENRIVPIQRVDLLTMYGLVLCMSIPNLIALDADTDTGDFVIEDGATPMIANEPVKACEISSGVSSATLYFVADYSFAGFTTDGATVSPTVPDEGIVPDAKTLYKATITSGAVAVEKIGF